MKEKFHLPPSLLAIAFPQRTCSLDWSDSRKLIRPHLKGRGINLQAAFSSTSCSGNKYAKPRPPLGSWPSRFLFLKCINKHIFIASISGSNVTGQRVCSFRYVGEREAGVGLYCRLLAPTLFLQGNSVLKTWASFQVKIKQYFDFLSADSLCLYCLLMNLTGEKGD